MNDNLPPADAHLRKIAIHVSAYITHVRTQLKQTIPKAIVHTLVRSSLLFGSVHGTAVLHGLLQQQRCWSESFHMHLKTLQRSQLTVGSTCLRDWLEASRQCQSMLRSGKGATWLSMTYAQSYHPFKKWMSVTSFCGRSLWHAFTSTAY